MSIFSTMAQMYHKAKLITSKRQKVSDDMCVIRTIKQLANGDLLVSGNYSRSELLDDGLKLNDFRNVKNWKWHTIFKKNNTVKNKYTTCFKGCFYQNHYYAGKYPYKNHEEFDVAYNPRDQTLIFKNPKLNDNMWRKQESTIGIEGTYIDCNHLKDINESKYYPGTSISLEWVP